MRSTCLSAVLVLYALAPHAWSQPEARPRVGRSYLGFGVELGWHPLNLVLNQERVQKEIGLGEKQKARIEQLQRELEKVDVLRAPELARQTQMAIRAGASMKEVTALFSAASVARMKELDSLILKVLDKKQGARLQQIRFQYDGPMAFLREDVQEGLSLAEDQVELIKGVVSQGRQELIAVSALPEKLAAQLAPTVRRTREQRRALFESEDFAKEIAKAKEAALKSRAATMQKIRKLLTKGQRARYQSLVGPPFELFPSPKRNEAAAAKN